MVFTGPLFLNLCVMVLLPSLAFLSIKLSKVIQKSYNARKLEFFWGGVVLSCQSKPVLAKPTKRTGHRGGLLDCCGRAGQQRFRFGGRRHVTADTGRVSVAGRHQAKLPALWCPVGHAKKRSFLLRPANEDEGAALLPRRVSRHCSSHNPGSFLEALCRTSFDRFDARHTTAQLFSWREIGK